jgi:thiamine-monophosphate kinase
VAGRPLPGEFELIARYFAPLAAGSPGAAGLTDDVAALAVGPDEQLIVKSDAIVGGVHFLPGDPPDLIGRKLLRVNLSDLAGKGARPLGYLMTCAFPREIDEPWVAGFVEGLAADQEEFGLGLLGGDTTATPGPVTLSATVLGAVARDRLPRRGDARDGDAILVSGSLGDGALGLDVLRDRVPDLDVADREYLIDRYRLPQPRLALGRALVEAGIVHASMDVSDGLLADLGHICSTSGLGGEIEWARVPLSAAAARLVGRDAALRGRIVAGGDDYELLLTVAAVDVDAALAAAARVGAQLTAIGSMRAGTGVRIVDERGRQISIGRTGYRHF